MLKIGEYNTLKIKTFTNIGCFLENETDNSVDVENSDSNNSVFMQKRDIPLDAKRGDQLEVFVYNDSKEQIRATTRKPLAIVGELCALKIKDIKSFGLFLEWGISKDLFVPQKTLFDQEYNIGDLVIVYVCLDFEKKGVIGTPDFWKYLSKEKPLYQMNDEVSVIVYDELGIGYKVIVDGLYLGMIYKNEVSKPLSYGDSFKAYIKKVREDSLIDISEEKVGYTAVVNKSQEIILNALRENDGYLALNDHTPAGIIRHRLGMSKKSFKKTVGGLWRKGIIQLDDEGVRLPKK